MLRENYEKAENKGIGCVCRFETIYDINIIPFLEIGCYQSRIEISGLLIGHRGEVTVEESGRRSVQIRDTHAVCVEKFRQFFTAIITT